MKIKKLEWDSKFFDSQIGKIEYEDKIFSKSKIDNIDQYDLVYLFSKHKFLDESLPNPYTKVDFEFKLAKYQARDSIKDNAIHTISEYPKKQDLDSLKKLALTSGQYSRFKLDNKFKDHEFNRLYNQWLINSLDNKIADSVLTYKLGDGEITGFITIKSNKEKSRIGLLAVDKNQRGKGIGGKLLETAKRVANENNSITLSVATQLENKKACAFYEGNGFKLKEKIYIYHLWNR